MCTVCGTGLTGYRSSEVSIASGTSHNCLLEHHIETCYRVGIQYLFCIRFSGMIFQYVTVAILNLEDNSRLNQLTIIGEYAVCLCHIPQRYTLGQTANGGRQVVIAVLAGIHQTGNSALFGCLDDIGHAYLVGQVNGRNVHGLNQRFDHGDRAAGSMSVVLRRPSAGKAYRTVIQHHVRAHTLFQSGYIGKRLEGRTWLTVHLRSTVKLVLSASTYHGLYIAGLGFNSQQSALRLSNALGILCALRQVLVHRIFCILLHIQIQCGVNLQTFLVNSGRVILVTYLLYYVVDEIGSYLIVVLIGPRLNQAQILRLGFIRLFLSNVAILGHLIQYYALTVLGRLQVVERGIIIRAVRKTGQHSALRQVQVLNILAKIYMGSGLYAIRTLAEINLIHVHFQDFRLGVLVFDFHCQYGFQQLSLQRLFLCEERVSCQLLGNGGTTLSGGIPVPDIAYQCTGNADRVNPMMLIETDIFCRNECILQFLRRF